MLSEWDSMSGLRLRRGRCTGTVDLLVCNTRNEELIIKNEADIATCNCRLSNFQSLLLRDSSESIHKVCVTISEYT